MHTKLCNYRPFDDHGQQVLTILHHPDQLHHSYMDKLAAPYLPQVREFIDRLKPDPKSIYALINALGAFEYYSSNINGDAFEEEMLMHSGPIYGYETFVHYAKPFMHHCFRAGTEVVMGDRIRKPIALIKSGELVETRLGPRPVKRSISRHYSGPGVRLSLSGVEEDIEGSWDHPVFVFQRDQIHCSHKYSRLRPEQRHFEEYPSCLDKISLSLKEIPLGEVLPGDYMVFPRPQLGGEQIPDEFAELVGWVASEGYCAGQRGMIQFTFCEFNHEDIKSVSDCLKNNGLNVTKTDIPDKEQVVLSSWSVELWDRLQEYVVGVKSEKHLTGRVLSWNERAIKLLLGVYIDGDGHVPKKGRNEGQLRIRSSSQQMLKVLSDIIRALGIPTTIQWDQKPGYRTFPNGKTYWCSGSGTVTVTPQFSQEITLYSRKYYIKDMKVFRPRPVIGNFFLVRVTGKEDTFLDEDLYNLEVDDVPEYVAGEVLVHNCNKGPDARVFGSVELSCWNPNMHRVEVVARLDRQMAELANAQRVIDKIDHGELPETSMGAKVLFDLCSITTDWDEYKKALATYNPNVHRHPGFAVLHYHKTKRPIQGLAIDKDEWTDIFKTRRNDILPDGRKVFVYNPYPRFFDISFVFIGAEKTSKVMAKLASRGFISVPRNLPPVSEYTDKSYGFEKSASVEGARNLLKEFKKKASQLKSAEHTKRIVPSQFGDKAVSLIERAEPDLPRQFLDMMSEHPLQESLSTPCMAGITLKPKEFQRIVIMRIGNRDMADELDRENCVFRKVDDVDKSVQIGPQHINDQIAEMLKGLIEGRSAFGPVLKRRMIKIVIHGTPEEEQEPREVEDKLLDKISAAYNGYRENVIEKISSLSGELHRYPNLRSEIYGRDLTDMFSKTASQQSKEYEDMLGAVPATYLMTVFARRQMQKDLKAGREPDILTQLYADYPQLANTVVGLTALKASGTSVPDEVIATAINAGENLVQSK